MRGISTLLLLKGVQNQLDAARDPEFLINPKEVVAHGVLGQAELLSRVSVREAIGYQLHYIVFTLC